MSRLSVSLLALSAALSAGVASAETVKVTSPNGRIAISFDQSQSGLTYTVEQDGKAIIGPSPIEWRLDVAYIGSGSTITGHSETKVDSSWKPVVGKNAVVPDRYSQSDIALTAGGGKFKFNVIIRAYDNGVALRYGVPAQDGVTGFKVMSENTQFFFPADYTCWGANMGAMNTSFEGEYDAIKASLIREHNNYIAPLVCKTGDGAKTFAIAESDIKDYPGFYISGRGDGGIGVRTNLPPRFDNDRNYRFRKTVVADVKLDADGFQTPWRVVMIGDQPGDLTGSDLITTLATPSQITDTSWIRGRKTAWDWWNDWALDIPDAGINTASYKAYVDFAASMKLDDILIDEGWSVGSDIEPNPEADITKAKPVLDMPELLRYAKSKNVGVWVWVQWHQLDAQMEEALAAYEAWGLKGIKVDFMNRNDQEMVDYYHRLMAVAARHHLLVDMHGAYPPSGLNRTWPNYITQEGVMGAEYNKWSGRITATHNVTLPFTRQILGPLDYTPGGFRSLPPAEFASQRRNKAPFVQTTRGQAVAMYVVFDSPFQMVADSPSAYKKADGSWADGAEILQMVPTTWDETRVVQGDIGQYIVSARRKGDTWYVGAMTNESGRDVTVPLSFLGDGKFTAKTWQDGADVNSLNVASNATDKSGSLTLKLAPSGGAVAVITPETPAKGKKKKK
ncbi:alpha-glucosidase [Asticcacaulis sp. AC460]|uniref:glycoside hydrolase family 97 protein n=1 Tax=Asticcacaulis sp. AC460 TaxID=1282360 RepID=UPI0003C3D8E7|nr:glycoside hydrolase family 97 protein [Asticcacaulis sp. AC460]ESQ90030.1 alpha-glucosidase [Asticcacaulis sp. AC460]